ncbi:MAG: hypothetical protein J07HB67_02252 [halophilic archaeon J07HB67]|jgi:hypothetical protein|nr:MAG: hypothetical protein J07HB67_02252 [halophilic archaeon J07HB67]
MMKHVGARGRTILSTASQVISIGVALFLNSLDSPIGSPLAGGILVGTLLLISAEKYVTVYNPTIKLREQQLSTFFRDYLSLIENDIEAHADGEVSVRANVMQPTPKSSGLLSEPEYEITYYKERDQYDPEEFEFEFGPGEGCVGHVHESEDQEFALSPDLVSGWEDGWSTTKQQDRVTEELETVVGTPIFDPDSEAEKLKGALMIDSEQSIKELVGVPEGQDISEVSFEETDIAQRAATHASSIGIVL